MLKVIIYIMLETIETKEGPYQRGKYVWFSDQGHLFQGSKTRCFLVMARHTGVLLGRVKWYPGFRKYSFYPEPNTKFDKLCLRDIADFCEIQGLKHKQKKRIDKVDWDLVNSWRNKE